MFKNAILQCQKYNQISFFCPEQRGAASFGRARAATLCSLGSVVSYPKAVQWTTVIYKFYQSPTGTYIFNASNQIEPEVKIVSTLKVLSNEN
jgi:hypothetical protein